MRGKRLRILIYTFLLLSFSFLLGTLRVVRVNSDSMADTIHADDYVLVARLIWFARHKNLYPFDPPRGQIVLLHSPVENTLLVKRIVGVGEDRIRISGGRVILNGMELEEPHVRHQTDFTSVVDCWPLDLDGAGVRDVPIPRGSYFVLGDNRRASLDSRHWGPVPQRNIIGAVIWTWRRKT